MRPLALIPAKGVSERLPGKNLLPLGGKPLLLWTVEAAQASRLFDDRIYVASEDDAILALAHESGVQTLRRPDLLAAPEATVEDVVKWSRLQLEWRDPVYVLLPTSPFRTPRTLCEAWVQYGQREARVLMSVVPNPHPPFWAILWEGASIAPMMPAHYQLPRAALPQTWRHDGSYLIVGASGNGICVFRPPAVETTDINTAQDLEYAEYLVMTGKVPVPA